LTTPITLLIQRPGTPEPLDTPTPELEQGCCSFGAHFVDEEDVDNVVKAFVRLTPEQMQFHDRATRGGFLRPGEPADDGVEPTVTRRVDGKLVMLSD